MSSLVIFRRGPKVELPSSSTDGTIYITTDTGEILIGNGKDYDKLSDVIICEHESDLPPVASIIPTKLYYVSDTNSLYRYLDNSWKPVGGGGGTNDYEQLTNLPQINGTTLIGNKSTEDIIPIGKGLMYDSEGKIALSYEEVSNPSGGTTVTIGS